VRRIVRRPDLGSWYFLGETLFVRVLYRPFFTRKKPSMAFFRCLFSVLLKLHAEKPSCQNDRTRGTPQWWPRVFSFSASLRPPMRVLDARA
jgi:hypothetical protein